MRLTDNPRRDIPICLAIMAVVAAIILPVFAQPKGRPWTRPEFKCMSGLKQGAIAMQIYQVDADGRFPSRDGWADGLYPYTKRWDVLRCPNMPQGSWGYAFNGALDRVLDKKVASLATTPMLYDSVNPVKNASDLVASLPAKPRHRRNTMLYADGHAKGLFPFVK